MQGIELKEFQIDCVNKLLDATTVGNKKEILVQAPTGSGKTIILLDYIVYSNVTLLKWEMKILYIYNSF